MKKQLKTAQGLGFGKIYTALAMVLRLKNTQVIKLLYGALHLPTISSFLIFRPMSLRGVTMPSNVPNIDPKPKFISIEKNMTLQKGPPGMWIIASVKAMKAKPGPDTACGWRQITRQHHTFLTTTFSNFKASYYVRRHSISAVSVSHRHIKKAACWRGCGVRWWVRYCQAGGRPRWWGESKPFRKNHVAIKV